MQAATRVGSRSWTVRVIRHGLRPVAASPGAARGDPDPVTDPEAPRPDIENEDEDVPAFDLDLDPEDQGTAEAAAESSG